MSADGVENGVFHLASEYPRIQVFRLGRAVHDLVVAQAGLAEEVHVVTNSIGGRDQEVVDDGVFGRRIDHSRRQGHRVTRWL